MECITLQPHPGSKISQRKCAKNLATEQSNINWFLPASWFCLKLKIYQLFTMFSILYQYIDNVGRHQCQQDSNFRAIELSRACFVVTFYRLNLYFVSSLFCQGKTNGSKYQNLNSLRWNAEYILAKMNFDKSETEKFEVRFIGFVNLVYYIQYSSSDNFALQMILWGHLNEQRRNIVSRCWFVVAVLHVRAQHC